MHTYCSDKQSNITESLQQIEDAGRKVGIESERSLISIRNSILEVIKQNEILIEIALKTHTLSKPTNEAQPHDQTATDQREEIATMAESLLDQKEKYESDLEFLSSLHFPDMQLRQEAVKDAHSKTFEWIFREIEEDNSVRQFPSWPGGGNGVFWIRGKAGSGKSTLIFEVLAPK